MKAKFLTVLFLAVLFGCKKDAPQQKHEVNSFTDLKVPSNFKFETVKEVQFSIDTEDKGFSFPYKIEVYDYVPAAGGGLIYSAFTSNNQLQASANIPSHIKTLYVVKTDPNGSSSMVVKEVNNSSFSHSFGKNKVNRGKTTVVSPDCNTGCDQTINSGGWININSAGVYCLTGNVSGINVNNGNATIRVCGNITLTGNISLQGNSSLEITSGSTLNVAQVLFNGNSTSLTIYPDATLNTTGNFPAFGTVVNHGTINTPEVYTHNTFTNNGTFNVTGTGYSTINNNYAFTNNGTFSVNGHLTVQNNADLINNCSMLVNKDLQIGGGEINNYEFIKVNENLHLNSSTELNMYNGAMISVNSIDQYFSGTINGYNSTSLVKVAGIVNANNSGKFTGNLEMCIAGSHNLTITNIVAPSSLACDVYLPTTSCNTEGNGTPVVQDTDGDGVADDTDLFPTDPERAGEAYYPGSQSFGTVAFEDLWPAKGDYDFNDVVVDYRTRFVTNAGGDVVDMEVDYILRAIGGSLRNGFGFQFDALAPSDIASVTRTGNFVTQNLNGNGTEAGQSRAVIIFFEDAFEVFGHVGTPTVNTDMNSVYYTPDTNNVSINFSSPKNMNNVPGNPFIYIGQDRGKEVHLSGQIPTDLMDHAYFGSMDDDSDPGAGEYYVTSNNLPWALITAESWVYPTEKNDVVKSYLKFGTWAESGGVSFPNWQEDLNGYRDDSKIYEN